MSMPNVSFAERVAFGHVEDPEVDPIAVHMAPRPWTALFGRIMLAAIFAISGIAKLTDPAGTVEHMEQNGVPMSDVLVWIAGVAEVAGAAALIFGLLTRIGALGLIVFLALANRYFHDFWAVPEAEVVMQLASFMKNVGLAGGLMLLIAFGPGRFSLDHKLRWPIQA